MSGDMISTLTSFCSNCRNNYCQNLKPQYFGGCMKWIGHRNSRVADSWKARLGVTSVAIPCHTQQQSLMTFTSEGTPHYTRVAHLLHEQQLPVRNSNHRGSANVRLYTKERREKKFYCHVRAWGYSRIRTSERRLSFNSAAIKSRSRSYVVLYHELSIDTGQTILQQQSLLQRRNCLQSS